MNIAILDDEDDILFSLKNYLSKKELNVFTYKTGKNIIEEISKNKINIIFIDINLNEEKNGIDYIVNIKKTYPNIKIIAISGNADIKTAVIAMKKGAMDFIEKPLEIEELELVLKNVLELETLKNERDRFYDEILDQYKILGSSKLVEQLKEKIFKYANISENVLITGENGSGKELVAANLHYLSNRKKNKYYKINIASYPENLIESELFGYTKGSFSGADKDYLGIFRTSNGSTLFIDEIGEMKTNLQAKLLRVIQDKEVLSIGSTKPEKIDVRLIFATNRNLINEIQSNTFREDLYYRISTLIIEVPPLRDRKEDIKVLAEKFLLDFSNENNIPVKEFTKKALEKLESYNYPGNIRELKNIITRSAINCINQNHIDENSIEFDISNNNKIITENSELIKEEYELYRNIFFETKNLKDKKHELENLYIKTQIKKFNNDLKKTAKELGILINNIYRKI